MTDDLATAMTAIRSIFSVLPGDLLAVIYFTVVVLLFISLLHFFRN